MKRILNILLFILLANALLAQGLVTSTTPKQNKKTARILKQANQQMDLLKYAYAIPLYKNYLKQLGKEDSVAFKQLGKAYQLVNQYDSALLYYTKAAGMGVDMGNVIAELQALLGNYTKARIGYEQLLSKGHTTMGDARIYGFSNINSFYADSLDYTLYGTRLNTPYNEFNAVPFKGGIVFESNRVLTKKKKRASKIITPEFAWDGASYSRLYYVNSAKEVRIDSTHWGKWREKQISSSDLSKGTSNDTRLLEKALDYGALEYKQDTLVKLFSKQFGTRLNFGSISFTQDGKRAYYTRNGSKTKKGYLLEIWEARFMEGHWLPSKKLFFNRSGYNYFHPAVTPDGNRLYYASDETGGNGGTDIYYVDKNEDGSWKPTSNAGQAINTAGNELFPTFYEGNLYFSSNGHPGLGGLDIYKATIDARGDLVAKNVGYPVNSNKDDLGYSIMGKTGFFSSNRKGSDDIYAFDYAPAYIKLEGKVAVDSVNAPGKKVYITSTNDNGRVIVVDSAVVDNNGSYTLKARPNKEYTLITFDADGQRFDTDITTDGYAKNNDKVIKQVTLINIPLTETEKVQKKAQQDALWASQHKYGLNARTVDSLMQLSKDYVELHHPFNQERIIEKDLKEYNNLISRIRTMRGKEIVIVSATDCNGTEQYNEGLSQRRAKRIYNKINGLSSNKVVIKNVGERELLKACDDVQKSIEEQVINRYSFVFIIDKK